MRIFAFQGSIAAVRLTILKTKGVLPTGRMLILLSFIQEKFIMAEILSI